MKKNELYEEEQLIRGILGYQSDRESLSTGFYESCFFNKTVNNGSFRKNDLTRLIQVLFF